MWYWRAVVRSVSTEQPEMATWVSPAVVHLYAVVVVVDIQAEKLIQAADATLIAVVVAAAAAAVAAVVVAVVPAIASVSASPSETVSL